MGVRRALRYRSLTHDIIIHHVLCDIRLYGGERSPRPSVAEDGKKIADLRQIESADDAHNKLWIRARCGNRSGRDKADERGMRIELRLNLVDVMLLPFILSFFFER